MIHGLGVVLGLAGAVALVTTALTAHLGFGERAAVVLYATALVLMLGVSAVYNLYPVSPRKWLLRRADHALIYLMIAGTYTPLVALVGSGTRAHVLLAVIWAVAAIGIALKLFLARTLSTRLSIALYLILGWSGLLAYESVIAALQPTAHVASGDRRRALTRSGWSSTSGGGFRSRTRSGTPSCWRRPPAITGRSGRA